MGGLTGVPGMILLPVTVPADLIGTWRVQICMIVAIAYVYGHTNETTDLRRDIYLIILGDSFKEVLKDFSIEAGKILTRKTVDKCITREVMNKIYKVIGRKILTKGGEKSITSFVKLVPLVGAPIGFAFEWTATKTVGLFAIRYYSGRY
jgi:hypothetical protein